MSIKVSILNTGSGTDSLTGKSDQEGLTVSFENEAPTFLSWKSFKQLLGYKTGQNGKTSTVPTPRTTSAAPTPNVSAAPQANGSAAPPLNVTDRSMGQSNGGGLGTGLGTTGEAKTVAAK